MFVLGWSGVIASGVVLFYGFSLHEPAPYLLLLIGVICWAASGVLALLEIIAERSIISHRGTSSVE